MVICVRKYDTTKKHPDYALVVSVTRVLAVYRMMIIIQQLLKANMSWLLNFTSFYLRKQIRINISRTLRVEICLWLLQCPISV